MNITHRPSDELMLDYASGALSEGWALAVASHLSMCGSSSSFLRGMETIGGILLDEADEACISDKMFGSILDKIDSDMISPVGQKETCLLYTSPSPRDRQKSRMPSSA